MQNRHRYYSCLQDQYNFYMQDQSLLRFWLKLKNTHPDYLLAINYKERLKPKKQAVVMVTST